MGQIVFEIYELVDIIFRNLPYYYVSAYRIINKTCNKVGKELYDRKFEEEVSNKAYKLLRTLENSEFVTMHWKSLHDKFETMSKVIVEDLYPILVHDLTFLDRFIYLCIAFQYHYTQHATPYHINLKYRPWWNSFKKSFKEYCWIDYPEHFNLHELRQVARLKGLSNYSRYNRSCLIRKLTRKPYQLHKLKDVN